MDSNVCFSKHRSWGVLNNEPPTRPSVLRLGMPNKWGILIIMANYYAQPEIAVSSAFRTSVKPFIENKVLVGFVLQKH
jgi:hypothetical protein